MPDSWLLAKVGCPKKNRTVDTRHHLHEEKCPQSAARHWTFEHACHALRIAAATGTSSWFSLDALDHAVLWLSAFQSSKKEQFASVQKSRGVPFHSPETPSFQTCAAERQHAAAPWPTVRQTLLERFLLAGSLHKSEEGGRECEESGNAQLLECLPHAMVGEALSRCR